MNFISLKTIFFGIFCIFVNFRGTYNLNFQHNIYVFCREIPPFMLFGTSLRRCSMPRVEDQTLLHILYNGSRIATKECQNQFRYKPWNCSAATNSMKNMVFHVFPETAYLYAVYSAGAAFAMSYACSRGITKDCICPVARETVLTTIDKVNGTEYKKTFVDPFCSKESLTYGIKKTREALRNVKHKDPRSKIDEHNKEAGRLSLQRVQTKEVCHCRGVSGSCSTRKCFLLLPSFGDIAAHLVGKYNSAVKVAVDNYGKKIIPTEATFVGPTPEDLVYLENSPNYCYKDLEKGSLGTKSRLCRKDVSDIDPRSCKVLCCSRGDIEKTETVKEMCNCKFLPNIYTVSCETCERNNTIHVCK